MVNSDRIIKKHKKKVDTLEKVEVSVNIEDLIMIKDNMDIAGFYLKQQLEFVDTQSINVSILNKKYLDNRYLTKHLEEVISEYISKTDSNND